MATEIKEKPGNGKAKTSAKPKGKVKVASVRLPFLRETKGTNVYAIDDAANEKLPSPSPITSLYIAKPNKPGGLAKMEAIFIEVFDSE